MKFEEIKSKIENNKMVGITEIKEIPYGKCICLDNGGKVNCFNTGKHTIQGKGQEEIRAILEGIVQKRNRKIFVVYGHDEIARTQLEALLRRWDLEPIILDQQASGGQTIIEKLEEYVSDKSRVRQNVVLELGMFLAKLGRERVAILLKEAVDFEKPSDIQGLVYIPFQNKVDEVSISLIRELSQQGYIIDTTRI